MATAAAAAAASSASACSAAVAATTRPRSSSYKTEVFIEAPSTGRLGIKIAAPSVKTNGHCVIVGVDPTSPLLGKAYAGDWISRIYYAPQQNKDINEVLHLLASTPEANWQCTRTLTVLRDHKMSFLVQIDPQLLLAHNDRTMITVNIHTTTIRTTRTMRNSTGDFSGHIGGLKIKSAPSPAYVVVTGIEQQQHHGKVMVGDWITHVNSVPVMSVLVGSTNSTTAKSSDSSGGGGGGGNSNNGPYYDDEQQQTAATTTTITLLRDTSAMKSSLAGTAAAAAPASKAAAAAAAPAVRNAVTTTTTTATAAAATATAVVASVSSKQVHHPNPSHTNNPNPNNNDLLDRVMIRINAPRIPGRKLGLQIVPPTSNSNGHCVIVGVTREDSILHGQVYDGDWLTHVNSTPITGMKIENIMKIFAASSSTQRTLTVLRENETTTAAATASAAASATSACNTNVTLTAGAAAPFNNNINKPPPPAAAASAHINGASTQRRRFYVTVTAPPTGKLGLLIGSGIYDRKATDGHCFIQQVLPSSPLCGQVVVGDWIRLINGRPVKNVDFDTAKELLAPAEPSSQPRTLTLLRRDPSTAVTNTSMPSSSSVGINNYRSGATSGQAPISQSKYSAARVRARISVQDGTVAPASKPINGPDGLYLRPPGRTRHGMEWDAVRGVWVPAVPSSCATATATATTATAPARVSMSATKTHTMAALPFGFNINQHTSNMKPSAVTPGTAANKKRPAPAYSSNKQHKKPKQNNNKENKNLSIFDELDIDEFPEPGTVDTKCQVYSTLNNETFWIVAEKLGTEWRKLLALNKHLDGGGHRKLGAMSRFHPNTLLVIPNDRSQWKMKLLQPQEEALSKSAVEAGMTNVDACVHCGVIFDEDDDDAPDMLLCDGCDGRHHLQCVGLSEIPTGDWFCEDCLAILKARKVNPSGSAPYSLPKLPPLSPDQCEGVSTLQDKLKSYWRRRCEEETSAITENYAVVIQASDNRKVELEVQATRVQDQLEDAKRKYQHAKELETDRNGLVSWNISSGSQNVIEVRLPNGDSLKLNELDETVSHNLVYVGNGTRRKVVKVMSDRWKLALDARENVTLNISSKLSTITRLTNEFDSLKESIKQQEIETKNLAGSEKIEIQQLQAQYAARLNEPQQEHETMAAYRAREPAPRYLGTVHLGDDSDVYAMNFLREPQELIVLVPTTTANIEGDHLWLDPQVGISYGVFANVDLFCKTRDDELPLERNGVRDAQRRLFALLKSNNKGLVVSSPSNPPTVKVRGGTEYVASDHQYFDLTKLVHDCNVDLDLPKEPTPSSMKGVQLRDYQQSSLRWMLDKERSNSAMGLAGELWHRLRFLDPTCSNQDYFYCELTGSFALDIFDYREDVAQRDASINHFAMPTGGVLGEEMGLGKTVEMIALMAANPPPLHRRVLPREHLLRSECRHPDYAPPPYIEGISRNLSNGTLVIVPMTLLSQWVTEIERFAPHMSITTLHNAESATIHELAVSDVVIASTYLLQSQSSLLGMVKRIHWHRIIVDEAHYNQQGHTIKNVIASLSATHRAAVTGTPIGAQLSDLYGQLRFLRLAPFCRPDFWKNNVEDPYYERNLESLRVLRSLLSRIVIRHSKDQTHTSGAILLTLPPRTVETVHLQFGSEAEQAVYKTIDKRNLARINELKRDSRSKVTSHYFELQGLLAAARQACAHTSLINLDKLNSSASSTAKKSGGASASNTREGIFQLALERARHSAQLRMRVLLNKCQQGEYLECPICFAVVGECDVAIPACAHPFCGECILSLLNSGGLHREASGSCPECRDTIVRSDITFLGDANDAGTRVEEPKKKQDEDMAPTISNHHAFQLTANDVRVSVTNASSLRVGHQSMTADELRQTLQDDRAFLSSLDADFLTNFYMSESQVGSKISELLAEVESMIIRDPKSKCVVFTQFLGVLDVVGEELRARGIGCCRIDGNCKQHERADALLEFNSDPNMKVFLLSMRSGAVGLTLTAADHCFIMDTALNSAIEEQAIDRIHRIGQTRPVTVKRFVMQGSVEERLLGVRRSLCVDRTSAGTQISGSNLLAAEEAECSITNNYRRSQLDGSDDAKRQQRIEMLEILFGCSGTVNQA